MVELSYRMAGGRRELPCEITEAIELLHAGSLIIDDVEDGSQWRRGLPTLHREIGMPLAVNTGNWMYFQAIETLGATPLPRPKVDRLVCQTIRTIRRCHEGQALDVSARVNELSGEEIVSTARAISRLKTGGLTALSAWLGSVAAGGSAPARRAFIRFGREIGVCLQMHNDLRELIALAEGSDRCDDLRNARVTWPWAWAAKRTTSEHLRSLQGHLSIAMDESGDYRRLAKRLIDRIGDYGRWRIETKLDRELTLIGEHAESSRAGQEMRAALNQLRS
jgi:geranylgeranyl pyrophosphate synthase